jgi:hypothetical protein
VAAGAICLWLAPATAHATKYVDAVNGSSANDCSTPALSCTTIVKGLTVAAPTDTVLVESGTYGKFTLPRGKSVVASDFNANNSDPRPVISGDAVGPAVNVTSAALTPGKIEGFVINGNYTSIDIADSITVRDNVFNEDSVGTGGADVNVSGGTVIVRDNTFDDPLPTDDQWAIAVNGGSLTVENNTFSGFREAVDAVGVVNLAITGNTITGLHQADLAPPGDPGGPNIVDGFAIVLVASTATVTGNLIHQPALGGNPWGFYLFDSDPANPPASNTQFTRNRLLGLGTGVYVSGANGVLSFNGDLLANNSVVGISADTAPVSITNATIWGNGDDVVLGGASLTMDSTAVEDPIGASGPTCTITNSRGPTTSGNNCQAFQTSAAPLFVNPSVNNFHLQLGSPLIDAGNPVAPAGGSIDFDGDPRAVDGNCDGIVRRDIGADEAVRDCTPPETTIDSGPSGTIDTATATFTFSSSEPGSTFKCAVDGAALAACSGPGQSHQTGTLAEGPHTFRVAATDAAGNVDPTPAERSFTVDLPDAAPPDTPPPDTTPPDTTPPDTTIETAKAKVKTRRKLAIVRFELASNDPNARFECKLDTDAFASCSSSLVLKLKRGKHIVQGVAIDAAGNRDQTPATVSVKIVRKRRR